MRSLRLSLSLICATAPAWLHASGVCGRVVCQGGLAVPQARILISHADSGMTASTVTLADGIFAFPDLPAGDYTVTVEAEGYEAALPVAYRAPGDGLEVELEPEESAIQLQAFIFESPASERPLVGPTIDFGPAATVASTAATQDTQFLPARVYSVTQPVILGETPAVDRVGREFTWDNPLAEAHVGAGLDAERLLPALWLRGQPEGLLRFHAAYQAAPAESHTTDFLSPFDPLRGADGIAGRSYRGDQLHHRWSSTLSYNLNQREGAATALSLTYSGLGSTLAAPREGEASALALNHSLDLGLRQDFRLWDDRAMTFTLDLLNVGGLVGGLNPAASENSPTALEQMTQNNEDWGLRMGMSLDF